MKLTSDKRAFDKSRSIFLLLSNYKVATLESMVNLNIQTALFVDTSTYKFP